jgi:hypothetical protein
MHRVRRKCGQAHSDVLGAFRRRVTDPFAWVADNGLARADVDRAPFVLHMQPAIQDDAYFEEIGALAWFDPTRRRRHAGDAEVLVLRVETTDEFFD